MVTDVLLDRLRLRPGERVLDIGSGGGATSIAAGHRVGPNGTVVGADISESLVRLARQRAASQRAANVTFVLADAQTDQFGEPFFGVALSQFGVMFFEEPEAAFTNICRQVEPGGRLGFACWQGVDRNPWHLGHAVGHLLPAPPGSPGGAATGPFSFGDAETTGWLLTSAGWVDVESVPHEASVTVGRDALVDDGQPAFMGVPAEKLAEARVALQEHLARFEAGDQRYRVPLAYQVFTASKPCH